MSRLATALCLAVVHVVMTGSATAGSWALGLALGALIALVGGARPGPSGWTPARFSRIVAFALGVARELLVGGWLVLRVLAGLRTWRRRGTVEIPLLERTRRGAVVSGLVATATPGSVLVDVDERRGVMVLHVIDASDPERTREAVQRFYRQFQRPLLP